MVSHLGVNILLGSEQALALVREPDTFEGEAEHEKITKNSYVCAANNHRQKKAACSEPNILPSLLVK